MDEVREECRGGSVGGGGGGSRSSPLEDGYLLFRIHVPELNIQKCLQFPKDQFIWNMKQQVLASLPKELKESFNYGLFLPPNNGKAGKFLDEERRLVDYPFNGPVGYLELKYKRRVYKMLNLDEKQLKALHTRTNFRRLLDYVANGQVEKITKMCSKGLDPNFHCTESGETPLTYATGIKKPGKVLMALVNGGALLDYRTKDGSTAMHRAVEHNSLEAVTTLLELGASPNYRDSKGLTPLYLAVTHATDPLICGGLLHDRSMIGAQDLQGWQEVHQACRNGLVQHLEHLLFYGADMNAQNASGNTPLHVCAVNNQESCARLLLFRGCHKEALNFANQTAYQVAVIAGNLELAEIIQNHRPENVDKSMGDTSDIISDSSGVGTSNSDTTVSISLPGTVVVCTENYTATQPGHLSVAQGDLIEVTGATDCGLLEGNIQGNPTSGLFPAHCVQEMRGTQPTTATINIHPRVSGRRESVVNKHFATAPRHKKQLPAEPRTVVLHRARRGFGFVLRGAKATSPLMELEPSDRCPALQYLDDVDKGGVADLAGLKKGDYLIAINGEDVSAASHERVVELIRSSGDLVSMTVVSLGAIPSSKSAATLSEITPNPRQYATLPRKLNNFATLGRSTAAPLPPRRNPKTTLSIGKARAKSMIFEDIRKDEKEKNLENQIRTISIRNRPTSGRITAVELEELFQRQQSDIGQTSMMVTSVYANGIPRPPSPTSSLRTPRVYASVAEMKRSKGKSNSRVRFSIAGIGGLNELKRDFHSTPDLTGKLNGVSNGVSTFAPRTHRSQEDIPSKSQSLLPPPNHPPPPPPGQLIKVEIKNGSECDYGSITSSEHSTNVGKEGIMSSFKPTNSAKLYASPEDVKMVGFRSHSLPPSSARPQVRKSHSVRSTSVHKPCAQNQVPNGNQYATTAKVFRNSKKRSVSPAPPIPNPDYSLSEEESENETEVEKPVEGSGNSSSNSSSSMPHSLSVEEIQKVRTQLRSSKSYPNDFLLQSIEDGDNSSSGVSSDQEPCPSAEMTTSLDSSTLPRVSLQRTGLTRNAVSLAQLPPPLELDLEEVVPPPPEFVAANSAASGDVAEVLAPPPQFSDNRLVTRVRIVSAVPKQ
ncbi:SH3 and multiple ankyrin repeat domains protein 3 isoform X3 [Bemisia tabaci]|uniref:SH3 and multiple ankyrin repeat domains protein 3 isoform X3 n=1 Tax=Bemisia tabaci TaxID=7038 RepID=UPI003B28AC72